MSTNQTRKILQVMLLPNLDVQQILECLDHWCKRNLAFATLTRYILRPEVTSMDWTW